MKKSGQGGVLRSPLYSDGTKDMNTQKAMGGVQGPKGDGKLGKVPDPLGYCGLPGSQISKKKSTTGTSWQESHPQEIVKK